MPPVSIVLNILWILFGGIYMAAGWVIAAVIMAITIIGLPWARAAFNIAAYTLLPFGQKAVRRDSLTGQPDIGTDTAPRGRVSVPRRRVAGTELRPARCRGERRHGAGSQPLRRSQR